jgi:8-oxo-dGTP pyrophosphatase MutT (NUDIX family)
VLPLPGPSKRTERRFRCKNFRREGYPISEQSEFPINRYNAAGGVVVWNDKVLILYRRLRNDFRLPKGHIEPAETPVAAALREIGEEAGIPACT